MMHGISMLLLLGVPFWRSVLKDHLVSDTHKLPEVPYRHRRVA